MRKFLIGVALGALASGAAYAGPGNGVGHGNGGGHGAVVHGPAAQGPASHGPASHAPSSHGPTVESPAQHGPSAKAQSHGPSMKAVARQQPHGSSMRASSHGPASHPPAAEADHPGKGHQASRGNARAAQAVHGRAIRDERTRDLVVDRRDVRPAGNDARGGRRLAHVDLIAPRPNHGLLEGCPPGLAKKNNGCTPPGLARARDARYAANYYRPALFGYPSLGDGRYYYDNGYLYRLGSGDSVLGYLPLLGGALSIGNPWPAYYQPMPVPDYYVDYYNLGPLDSYRYAGDTLYRIDPHTSAITSIAALLTGDTFAVGQRMPLGYDVYNVPYGYQDQYYDTPQANYRYADGYIYQIDPTTQLIAAAIQLLV